MRTISTEFAVIAGGPAGLSSAISAAESGLQVVVFEKAANTGGAGNMGMGPFAVGSRVQKKNMIGLTKDEAFAKFMEYTHWRVDAQLVRKYIDKSAETIEWLEDMGVEFYDSAKYFSGSEATWHRVKPDDGVPGPRAASKMYALMTARARELGVEFMMETTVKKILTENGRAVGCVAVDKTGEEITCRAEAVLLATGGFSANSEMVEKHLGRQLGKNLFLSQIPGLCGEGICMAWEAGAGRSEMTFEMTFGMPMTKNTEPDLHRTFCQPNLVVNLDGERFLNEAILSNTTFAGNAIDLQREHCAFSILESSIVRYYERHGLDCVSLVHPVMEISDFASH